MTRRPARATQAEMTRAYRAAQKLGPHVAVDFLPDGTIRLLQATPQTRESGEHGKNPWDE